MVIEVEVDSDAPSAARMRVEVDAGNDPHRVEDVSVPYTETFQVPLNTPFPLTGTTVEATASTEANWISCRITLDGKVVAEQRVAGAGAGAVCEKKLRVGPQ